MGLALQSWYVYSSTQSASIRTGGRFILFPVISRLVYIAMNDQVFVG